MYRRFCRCVHLKVQTILKIQGIQGTLHKLYFVKLLATFKKMGDFSKKTPTRTFIKMVWYGVAVVWYSIVPVARVVCHQGNCIPTDGQFYLFIRHRRWSIAATKMMK